MLDENSINERIKVLDGDIAKVAEQMQSLEKQKSDAVAMMNALQGAKQQCQSFLNELNNDEPDVSDSDSSDVE
jgi:peptidoglycan hydrolase CwlO-like protein